MLSEEIADNICKYVITDNQQRWNYVPNHALVNIMNH